MLCTTENPLVKIDPDGIEALIIYLEGRMVSFGFF